MPRELGEGLRATFGLLKRLCDRRLVDQLGDKRLNVSPDVPVVLRNLELGEPIGLFVAKELERLVVGARGEHKA